MSDVYENRSLLGAMLRDAALERIGVIVGWGENPRPDDSDEALDAVRLVLNRYVAGLGPT